MRLSPPTSRQPRHARHAPRLCTGRRVSAATRGSTNEGTSSPRRGLHIAYRNDALFVEDWVYEYGLLDELAINAYWTERYTECVDACDRLLSEGKLPTEQRDRVLKNRNFAVSKICETAAPSSSESEAFMKLLRAAREKEATRSS